LEQASTATKTGLPFNAQIDPGAPGVVRILEEKYKMSFNLVYVEF
jgi:hypothetical protein